VKSAFDSGAKIDSVNDFGMTALMMAVANNKVDTIRYLMSKNPGMSFRNGAGKTVIDLASTDEIRALLRR
jgi:ankyrin repeat protein